jgi:hypothetical protein
LSTITRFSVRSSGRDINAVRRATAVKPKKLKAPKASRATADATVTHAKATSPKASEADSKATVKPSVPDA